MPPFLLQEQSPPQCPSQQRHPEHSCATRASQHLQGVLLVLAMLRRVGVCEVAPIDYGQRLHGGSLAWPRVMVNV